MEGCEYSRDRGNMRRQIRQPGSYGDVILSKESEPKDSPYLAAFVEYNGKMGLDNAVTPEEFIDRTVDADDSHKEVLATELSQTCNRIWDGDDDIADAGIFFLDGRYNWEFPLPIDHPEVQDYLRVTSTQKLTTRQLLDIASKCETLKYAVAERAQLPMGVLRVKGVSILVRCC